MAKLSDDVKENIRDAFESAVSSLDELLCIHSEEEGKKFLGMRYKNNLENMLEKIEGIMEGLFKKYKIKNSDGFLSGEEGEEEGGEDEPPLAGLLDREEEGDEEPQENEGEEENEEGDEWTL